MAKDGSRRGGARPGAGRKPKLKAINPKELIKQYANNPADPEIPPCNETLLKEQKGEIPLHASVTYYSIYAYIKACGALNAVPKELVELFAQSYSRWRQAEDAISLYGMLATNPKTGAPIKSPLVTASIEYSKMSNQYWYAINAKIKEAGVKEEEEDPMANLLSGALSGIV